jgi:carbonic anhydrase
MSVATYCIGQKGTQIIVGLILSTFAIGYVRSEGWSYHGELGPDHWSSHYPTCGGLSQSPINIVSQSAAADDGGNGLHYIKYDHPIMGLTLINNGHTVQVKIPSDADVAIEHSQLSNRFTLTQFHIHWGSEDAFGSEHSLNNKFYPMEMHLVHYNSDLYPDVASAAANPNGLAVLGVLVEVDDAAILPVIDTITGLFSLIPHGGDVTTVPAFSIDDLLPSNKNYFHYNGSLTTPSCYESVNWFVYESPVKVTSAQITQFRTLLHSNHHGDPDETLVNNYRPVQPLNGRVVVRGH